MLTRVLTLRASSLTCPVLVATGHEWDIVGAEGWSLAPWVDDPIQVALESAMTAAVVARHAALKGFPSAVRESAGAE